MRSVPSFISTLYSFISGCEFHKDDTHVLRSICSCIFHFKCGGRVGAPVIHYSCSSCISPSLLLNRINPLAISFRLVLHCSLSLTAGKWFQRHPWQTGGVRRRKTASHGRKAVGGRLATLKKDRLGTLKKDRLSTLKHMTFR